LQPDVSDLHIAMAQLNMTVGDIDGNAQKIRDAVMLARDKLSADLIIFPELTLTGYPPEDLLLRPGFIERAANALVELRRQIKGIDVVLGLPTRGVNALYNEAVWLREGQVIGRYRKQHLPNYSVFDEKRYFTAGDQPCVVDIKGFPVAVTICEDLWRPGPMVQAKEAGGRLMVNLNASPYHAGKTDEREAVLRARVHEGGMPIFYVNLVGGQDELVFDGGSLVMNAQQSVVIRTPHFRDGVYAVKMSVDGAISPITEDVCSSLSIEASIYQAIVLGVRDYIEKNGFSGVAVGLSGGIDSALTLAIAVDAIGKERVEAVMMPSQYTATISLDDAKQEAQALGVEYNVLPIEPVFQAFLDALREEFAGTERDVTEENIQARCRGVILMAIANKKHKILLTTGNKSEMAVGYATLYGDMAGGFAPIKDVPKTMVYRLCRYRNSISAVIPQRVLERPPTAELAPDQKDEDTLPPYDELDPVLELYIEQDKEADEIIALGYDADMVRRVVAMVNRNEYKRRQAPPGVRITQRAFGRDRRYPITCR